MKRLSFAAAAVLLTCSTASARGIDACAFESEFDLHIAPGALTFERAAGRPARVVMRQGTLQLDGRQVELSPADVARVRNYERSVRALVPEVKAIAIDAVAIATEAVSQVATRLAGDDAGAAVEKMHAIGERLVERIELADDTRDFDQGGFEREIAALTAEIVPVLVGDVTAAAIKVALSGDVRAARELEQRAQTLERELEQHVERRADALKVRVDALCPRLAALDALEAQLELRLAGGAALDLLQAE
jgi:hypothetical protein